MYSLVKRAMGWLCGCTSSPCFSVGVCAVVLSVYMGLECSTHVVLHLLPFCAWCGLYFVLGGCCPSCLACSVPDCTLAGWCYACCCLCDMPVFGRQCATHLQMALCDV
jgi:hypothetical protein